ncbi:MAG: hypothetical protein D6761_01670 [Candidatus Dadabacteria bacterium]|nr:MAG: hypothetical protein D6761_01670 [Candidatus Dadabacteria bacterium]
MTLRPAILSLAVVLTACATSQPTPTRELIDTSRIPADVPVALQRAWWPIVAAPARDRVLHRLNFALAAARAGAFRPAEREFDQALNAIASVFSDRKNAKKALKLWYEEGMKDFKGEPYERAMAYGYRGLLYALAGEYDNARAAFESGFQQDAVAIDADTVADFSSLLYLKAWASAHMPISRSLAQDDWDDYQKLVPQSPLRRPAGRIAIIETGSAPRKVADGVGHAELVYRRGKGYQPNHLQTANGAVRIALLEDLFLQAATRGPRFVDRIIQNKAQFMERSLATGTVLSEIGDAAWIANIWSTAAGAGKVGMGAGYASDALGLASAISLLLSAKANPHVDTRYWAELPDRLYVVELADGATLFNETFELTYPDGWSFSVPATETVVVRSDTLEWYRVPHRFRYRPPIVYP